jgi:hypothetical protein
MGLPVEETFVLRGAAHTGAPYIFLGIEENSINYDEKTTIFI